MRDHLIASVGVASLLLLGLPGVAHAATETVSDSPGSAAVGVDNATIFRDIAVTAPGLVEEVTVTVDFATHDGEVCSAPPGTDPGHANELEMALVSPAGTRVTLVYSWGADPPTPPAGAYSDDAAQPVRSEVTFEDAAAELIGATNGGAPADGVFRPANPLSTLRGETAAGVWQLFFHDAALQHAKCYYGATLAIRTDYFEPTTTSLSASRTTAAVGEEVILTAEVDPAATGDVDFVSGGTSLGVVSVSGGSARLPVVFDTAGDFVITAEYSGDAIYADSVSDSVTVRVTGSSVPRAPEPPARIDTGR